MHQILAILWAQDNVAGRLQLFAVLLAIAITILLLLGPYDGFSYELALVFDSDSRNVETGLLSVSQPTRWFAFAASLAVVGCLARQSARLAGLALILASSGFGVLAWAAARLTPLVWSYNSHLVIFGLLTGLALVLERGRNGAGTRMGSFSLGFAQLYVCCFYFQSALSKLLNVGPDWFTSGRTAWVYASEFGTLMGTQLANYPSIFSWFSVVVGLLELAFLPAFVCFPRLRLWLPTAAVLMHLAFWTVLDISFWHIWILYPAIFRWQARSTCVSKFYQPSQSQPT